MTSYVHYLPGGGLGDVIREAFFNNALGILKRWRLEHPRDTLRLVTCSHNPAHADLFVGQDWIDEYVPTRFKLEDAWEWQKAYEWHPEVFEGHTELRFSLPIQNSIYRPDWSRARAAPCPIVNIPAVGMACDVAVTRHERDIVDFHADRVVVHPFAGETPRWMPLDVVHAATAHVHSVVVGGDYARQGHASEHYDGFRVDTFAPRVLLGIIRRASMVVATESSVYYAAAMWGRPVAMLWVPGGHYDLVQRGELNWPFYLGATDPRNLFMQMPTTQEGLDRLMDWEHKGVA